MLRSVECWESIGDQLGQHPRLHRVTLPFMARHKKGWSDYDDPWLSDEQHEDLARKIRCWVPK